MAHHVVWQDDQHSIIRLDIVTEGSWGEIHAAVDEIDEELRKVHHRVDIIFYSTVQLPPGSPLPHFKITSERLAKHRNMGLFVSVAPRQETPFIKTMIDIVRRVYDSGDQHYGGFVNSLDDAEALIMKDRAKSQVPV